MSKTASWVFGVIFIIAGVWGFFSTNVLGFLAANTVSSVIHVIVGVILLGMAKKSSAGMTLKTVGVVYVVLAILGFLSWAFIPSSMATNWFYLVVGVVLAAIGFMGAKSSMSSDASMNMESGSMGGGAPTTPQM